MKQTINLSDFRDAFRAHDRTNFSYEGLEILFDYLESYEEDTGEQIELDVVALCCDYSEDNYLDIADNYMFYRKPVELEDFKLLPEDEAIAAVREYLTDNTIILGEHGGDFIYAQF